MQAEMPTMQMDDDPAGPRDLEDAVVGASGEMQFLHRLLQHAAESGIDGAVLADLRMGHAGVRARARAGEAGALPQAGGGNATANCLRWFSGFRPAQFLDCQCRRLDMEVDPVEQRPADAGAVALDLRRRAAAFVARVAKIT